MRYLAMPASLPYLFNGLRTGATAAVLGATVAEWLAGSHGLGFAMVTAMTTYEIPLMWADAALAMVLALAMTVAVSVAEQLLLLHFAQGLYRQALGCWRVAMLATSRRPLTTARTTAMMCRPPLVTAVLKTSPSTLVDRMAPT